MYKPITLLLAQLWNIILKMSFLGPLQEFRKSPLASSCLSVCPSLRMEQLGSHWTDFHKIWRIIIFKKSVEKI